MNPYRSVFSAINLTRPIHFTRSALRDKIDAEQQAGVLKNERLSFILATYQRNLEATERKYVALQQENVDLHIQVKQLVQNSSKLHHQIKELSSSNLLAGGGASSKTEHHNSSATVAEKARAETVVQEQQQQQYTAMYAALTEQIRELKDHLRSSNSVNNVGNSNSTMGEISPIPEGLAADETMKGESNTASRAALGAEAGLVNTASEDGQLGRLSRQSSVGDVGLHLSRFASAAVSPVKGIHPKKVATPPVATSSREKAPRPGSAASAAVRPPSAAEEVPTANNPHGFKTKAECLQHIAALEANSSQALIGQLQKAQQRVTELSLRNAALEEELASYQSYMRDVVAQYKKQLQYMKSQLKIKSSTAALAAAAGAAGLPIGEEQGDKSFKLPLIK
jgi:cell division protein FtsB